MKFLVVNDDDLGQTEVCAAAASTSGANIELKTETGAYLEAVAECQLRAPAARRREKTVPTLGSTPGGTFLASTCGNYRLSTS